MNSLTQAQADAIQQVIELVRQNGEHQTVTLADGSEVYAYPHARGVAWGVNRAGDGFNIARGVR
jgi:hypothetical protein